MDVGHIDRQKVNQEPNPKSYQEANQTPQEKQKPHTC